MQRRELLNAATYTGLGEHEHLASPSNDLETQQITAPEALAGVLQSLVTPQ